MGARKSIIGFFEEGSQTNRSRELREDITKLLNNRPIAFFITKENGNSDVYIDAKYLELIITFVENFSEEIDFIKEVFDNHNFRLYKSFKYNETSFVASLDETESYFNFIDEKNFFSDIEAGENEDLIEEARLKIEKNRFDAKYYTQKLSDLNFDYLKDKELHFSQSVLFKVIFDCAFRGIEEAETSKFNQFMCKNNEKYLQHFQQHKTDFIDVDEVVGTSPSRPSSYLANEHEFTL